MIEDLALPPWLLAALLLPWGMVLIAAITCGRILYRKALAAHRARTTPRVCTQCIHFDHAEGQRILRSTEALVQLTLSAPPWRAGQQDKKSNHAWEDFGACHLHGRVQHPSETCDAFTRRS